MTTPTNGFTKEICLKKGTKLYLDIKNSSSKFDLYLKKIGVIVDEFLSKEVHYVVTDCRTIATNHGGTHTKKFLHDGLYKSLTSRGQTLLMKSVNYPASQSSLDPIQFALKFNIPVVYVADLKKVLLLELSSLKKNKKTPTKSSGIVKLDKSFIKVEDLSMQFIPLFKKIHSINSTENCSQKKTNEEVGNVQKGDLGYCECCEEICDDFAVHRKGSVHKSFVAKKENFLSLDNLIGTLPSIDQLKTLSSNEDCYYEQLDNEKEISSTVPAEVSTIQNLQEPNKIHSTKSNCAIIRPWEIANSKSHHFEINSLDFIREKEVLLEQDSARYFKDNVIHSSKILPTSGQRETLRLDEDHLNVTTKNFPSAIQKEPLTQCLGLNVSNVAFNTTSAQEAKTVYTPEFDDTLSHFLQKDAGSNKILPKSCPTQSTKPPPITFSDNDPNQNAVLDGSNCHSFKPVCQVAHLNFEFSKSLTQNSPSRSSSNHEKQLPNDFLGHTELTTASHFSLSNPSFFPDGSSALCSTVPNLYSKLPELHVPSCNSTVKQKFKRLSLRNKHVKVSSEKVQHLFSISSGEKEVTSTSCSSMALQKYENCNLVENVNSIRSEKSETCGSSETVLWSSKLTSELKMLFTRIGKAPVNYC